MKESLVKNKSFEFALMIIDLYKQMRNQNEYVLSGQLLKSGTSIGANVEEALAGQTKKDFASKMSIASKEARETAYWLKLIQYSDIVKTTGLENIIQKNNELIKMLTSIVKTTYQNLKTTQLKTKH